MHVVVDLNWLLQFGAFASVAAFGIFYFARTRFFVVVDSNFRSTTADFSRDCNNRERMVASVGGATEVSDSCAVCARVATKHCAGCKRVKYCSAACQETHWNSGHMIECKETRDRKSMYALRERKISLVPAGWNKKILKQSNKIIFPYEEFVQFFNWEKPGCPPCGLLNCGNSCFANVVLQCLAYTRPLVAYFLEKGHKIECQMDKWCFLCEFQTHVERASQCHIPFAPINILSRLTNIGGSLGYGKQEDAHEFMRFAIDTMQSVCLDEFGGEKAVHPRYQETTLVQHIFGGHLQSQVICTKCNNVSNQFENMMDLTVEIHGDAESLEECLDQFTAKEWLHGDNMYKCDSCNDHVVACKRLAVRRAPNILTIALKRYQSGRFGKLNKRVTFPETLDLSSYTSELGDGNDVYKLYAVVVHVDMLNASFFGHYICYVKDFCGNWYRIDDSEVSIVDLDKVLSQRAYMLLYSRICARPSCLLPAEMSKKQENENVKIQRADPSLTQPTEDARGELDFSTCFGQASPLSDVENARRSNKRDANRALLRMPSEGSSAAEKCTFEKESAYDISSIMTSEVREENSANPTYIPGYAKCEGNGSASPAAKKSNRVSSAGAKLKPLFPPGFLNKQPQKEFIQRENKLSLEFTERTPGLQLNNNQTNEVVKPYFSSENGNLLKDGEEPHFVLENGKVSTESAACKSLENGDSVHQTACSERTKTNTAGSKATK